MPISLASKATAPRILSASWPSVISASGSAALVKIRLENKLCGDLIADGLLRAPAHPGAAQGERGVVRREALVAAGDGQSEAAFEMPREAQRPRRHGVSRAVGMRRQSDDEERRPPFLDQRPD